MAGVAKYICASNPNRELIEEVIRNSVNSVLRLVQRLCLSSKKGAVLVMWTKVVLDGLECDSRSTFV